MNKRHHPSDFYLHLLREMAWHQALETLGVRADDLVLEAIRARDQELATQHGEVPIWREPDPDDPKIDQRSADWLEVWLTWEAKQ
jgi:hypothetical protein